MCQFLGKKIVSNVCEICLDREYTCFQEKSLFGSFFFFLFLNFVELQFEPCFLFFKNKDYLIKLWVFLTFFEIITNFLKPLNIQRWVFFIYNQFMILTSFLCFRNKDKLIKLGVFLK